MKADLKLVRKKRSFSESFKRDLVSDFESGKFSVLQLEKLHGINHSLIYRWIYEYSKYNDKGYRVVEEKDSSSKKLAALEKKIKELERIVGQKQIQMEYYEKMIEIAKEEYDVGEVQSESERERGLPEH